MTTDADDRAAMAALAEELSYAVDDETIERCLAAAADLPYEPPTDVEGASVGRAGDDPYNALLAVYDEPRTTGADGPLAGLTVAIKDNLAVRGLELTCGVDGFAVVPPGDAVAVERLLDAGASIVGKANMDALAIGPGGVFSQRGQVENPAYPGRIPDGSSSGAAAAVAAGLVDVALGSDTGGSVRKPAACCGLVGAKPTNGLVPNHGLVPLAPSLDTIGPLARDVETAARALDAIAGHDPRDPASSRVTTGSFVDALDASDDLTVGLASGFLAASTDAVAETVRDLAGDLDAEPDVSVREVDLDADVSPHYGHVSGAEFAWTLRQRGVVRGRGSWYDALLAEAFEAALASPLDTSFAVKKLPGAFLDATTNGRSYAAARTAALAFERRVTELFAEVDLLVWPTLPTLPPALTDELRENPLAILSVEPSLAFNTRVVNLIGAPAVAVPAGERDGLPVSAMVVAPAFEDGRALRGARAIERVTA